MTNRILHARNFDPGTVAILQRLNDVLARLQENSGTLAIVARQLPLRLEPPLTSKPSPFLPSITQPRHIHNKE